MARQQPDRRTTDPQIAEAMTRLRAVVEDFLPDHEIARTAKSLLVGGAYLGESAVAKILIDRVAFWQDRLNHELDIYEAVRMQGAPVPMPRLLDGRRAMGILILEHLDGDPLARQRYPCRTINPADMTLLLDMLPALNGWQLHTTPSQQTTLQAAEQRLANHVARGLLPQDDADRVAALLSRLTWSPEFHHRDLLFSNCLMHRDRLALIDWEYAGYAIPGYDEALLWVLLMDHDRQRNDLLTHVQERGHERTLLFMINCLIILPREIHALRATRTSASLRRATALETELDNVRGWVQGCQR